MAVARDVVWLINMISFIIMQKFSSGVRLWTLSGIVIRVMVDFPQVNASKVYITLSCIEEKDLPTGKKLGEGAYSFCSTIGEVIIMVVSDVVHLIFIYCGIK